MAERLKQVKNGTPVIFCSECKTALKWGWLNEDVMALYERVSKEDWASTEPLICRDGYGCKVKKNTQ